MIDMRRIKAIVKLMQTSGLTRIEVDGMVFEMPAQAPSVSVPSTFEMPIEDTETIPNEPTEIRWSDMQVFS